MTTSKSTDAPPELLPCPFCRKPPFVLSEYETLPPQPRTVACRTMGCPIFNIGMFANEWPSASTGQDEAAELVTLLRQQASEIAKAGHNGWGNTMTWAADVLEGRAITSPTPAPRLSPVTDEKDAEIEAQHAPDKGEAVRRAAEKIEAEFAALFDEHGIGEVVPRIASIIEAEFKLG